MLLEFYFHLFMFLSTSLYSFLGVGFSIALYIPNLSQSADVDSCLHLVLNKPSQNAPCSAVFFLRGILCFFSQLKRCCERAESSLPLQELGTKCTCVSGCGMHGKTSLHFT